MILEKAKGKLIPLSRVAEVRFGIKTGANEFFYLRDEQVRESDLSVNSFDLS